MAYTILVPLDGSPLAERALHPAMELARQRDAKLVLLQVLPASGEPPASAQEYMKWRCETVQAAGLPVDVELAHGAPAPCILERAAEVDLMVLSSHGRSGFHRMILGSVTEKVVRRSPCPVLVVRSSRVRLDDIQRILVPLDGSKLALEALPEACRLAAVAGATLVLCRINEAAALDPWPIPLLSRDQEGQVVDEYLSEVAAELDPGITVEKIHDFGSAARTLVDLIESRNIDLVVMTTHGRSGFDRLVCGSVAENVLRASHVPVLLISGRRLWRELQERQRRVISSHRQ